MFAETHHIVSFYMSNIPEEVLFYQKKVFQKFGYNLNQIHFHDSHAKAIDRYLTGNNWEFVSLFDVDSIPLHRNVLHNAIKTCTHNNAIYGCAQQASHLLNRFIYAAPSFINFTYTTYEKLGKPSFSQTERADVGGEVTLRCREVGVAVNLLFPTHAEEKIWSLGEHHMFGLGTTYEGQVYHAFRIRRDGHAHRFIEKCKAVLDEE